MRVSERVALEAARPVRGERVLCTTLGRGQAGAELAAERPEARVACWFPDAHQHRLAVATIGPRSNLELPLSADAPAEAVELAVVPLSKSGEAELSRDLLQTAWQRLEVGGALVTAVDNPADRWVREQVGAWFERVHVSHHDDAVAYVARKTAAPRKAKNFRCEFAFRDRGRLLRAVSRPGVFSHRRVDPGARRLLEAADPAPGERVLDIGCGAGVVAIGLAARDPTIAVHAVDSHTRAVECALAGAQLNGLVNLTAELNSTGCYGQPSSFDLAVANPPYYGNFEIAKRFLDAARESLKPGGRVLVVTKAPDWYREHLPQGWAEVEVRPTKGYHLASATKP
jgi:16S rRNA (guanine1207-N2)-methyltransferase